MLVIPNIMLKMFNKKLAIYNSGRWVSKVALRTGTSAITIAYALITLKSASYINLNAIQVLGVVFMVMVVSMAVSNEYWKRKGDIE